jgi:hypothetical protein
MAARMSITVAQAWAGATGRYREMIGRYLVLLRCKVDAATVCRIRLSSGYNSVLRPYNDVDIANTGYLLIPIGEVSIPAFSYRDEVTTVADYVVGNHKLQISAERVSGAGSLHLDAVCLIPTDHMVYCSVPALGSTEHARFYTFADDTRQALKELNTGIPDSSGDFFMPNWYMPWSGGVFVMAGQAAGSLHTLTDATDISMLYYPRWKNFSPYA